MFYITIHFLLLTIMTLSLPLRNVFVQGAFQAVSSPSTVTTRLRIAAADGRCHNYWYNISNNNLFSKSSPSLSYSAIHTGCRNDGTSSTTALGSHHRLWSKRRSNHIQSIVVDPFRSVVQGRKHNAVVGVPQMRPSSSSSSNNNDEVANDFLTRDVFLSSQILSFLGECGKVIGGLTAFFLGYSLIYLYFNQGNMIYLPELEGIPRQNSCNPRGYRTPAEYNLLYEEHNIMTQDGISIHAWLLLQPHSKEEKVPTIIFFHGNAGNIGIRLPNAQQMYSLLKANILMVDYRAYGDSDTAKKPSEKGLKLDSEAALNFAINHPNVDPSQIFIYGQSLGGAAAFHIAEYAQKNDIHLAGLIVENTFLSIPRMVDVIFPFLSSPFLKELLLRNKWDSETIATKVKVPILYIVGEKDEIVPTSHGKELYERSLKSSIYTMLHLVKGGTHNETWMQGGSKYWDTMKMFLSQALACRSRPLDGSPKEKGE
mmetsp:Transcript_6304/g.9274  ORF Transcript_6304/g.9274 Transcript_6304/m.9274 type:complete len:483 (+) Transcript_6304:27-1475(+)